MCPHNMVNFGLLATKIVSLVWGTPANVNRFRVIAALLHSTLVVGVSQTLRRGARNGITELSQRAPPILGRFVLYSILFLLTILSRPTVKCYISRES